jgi:hypothetical protein
LALTEGRESAKVHLLADLHPAAPAPAPGGSLMGWLWLGIVVGIVVAGGLLIASRR